jgi:hypothetical protein
MKKQMHCLIGCFHPLDVLGAFPGRMYLDGLVMKAQIVPNAHQQGRQPDYLIYGEGGELLGHRVRCGPRPLRRVR